MYKIKTAQYADMLKKCYAAHQPLFITGGPGIGKSAIPRQVFERIAKENCKTFVEWSDLDPEKRKECINNPVKYFVFMDLRASQLDTTSLIGIPNMNKTDLLENIPYSWVIYFTTPGSSGAIFADELNLAPPIIQSITYSMIHDRVISDRRLSDDVYVFAAGNRSQDRAHTFDMPLPLRDRFAEAEVGVDDEAWVEWALNVGINPHLISFIKWKPSNLYNADTLKADKPATPRGIERASRLLKDLQIEDFDSENVSEDMVHMMVSISVGEAFATEFQAYCKTYRSLDWAKIFKNPSSIQTMSLDKQYAICAGIPDQFNKAKDDATANKIMDAIDCMREDFAIFSYRVIRGADSDKFREKIMRLKRGEAFAIRYGKFLMDRTSEG